MFKLIYGFFDKVEDRVRGRFSHYPILYAIAGGAGVVLFWRGVWHTADYLMALINARRLGLTSVDLGLGVWWDGPLSLGVGIAFLLLIGLFVSSFIGNEIIMSGLRGEKKLSEKTEREVRMEAGAMAEIVEKVTRITEKLEKLEQAQAPSDGAYGQALEQDRNGSASLITSQKQAAVEALDRAGTPRN